MGQDCIVEDEAMKVYQYLERKQPGQGVQIEQFNDLMMFQRHLRDGGSLEKSIGNGGTYISRNQLNGSNINKTFDYG